MISEEARRRFVRAGYRAVGHHSAIAVCHWTKESLRNGRVCYKEKWYGIQSHRCLEMTPALIWCTHKCLFCWRPLEYTICDEPEPDEPEEIIEGCVEARRSLLNGFKGNFKVDKGKWEEAVRPTSAAISLAGEPTLYPRISDLLEEFRKRGMATFLVTNGTRPDRLKTLETEPTNLYISLCAPDKETYLAVNRPLVDEGWERLQESLEVMKSFRCRRVIRLTLVKGVNMKELEKYAKMILKAKPDFVESKGFMHVGEARDRLSRDAMPTHREVVAFAQSLSKLTGYTYRDDSPQSCVALLSRN